MRNWKYFKWEIENISNSMFIKSCTHRVKVKGHLLTWRHLLQWCVYPVICVASMCLLIFWFTSLFHRHCKHERKSFHFKHNFSASCFLFFHDLNIGLYAFLLYPKYRYIFSLYLNLNETFLCVVACLLWSCSSFHKVHTWNCLQFPLCASSSRGNWSSLCHKKLPHRRNTL